MLRLIGRRSVNGSNAARSLLWPNAPLGSTRWSVRTATQISPAALDATSVSGAGAGASAAARLNVAALHTSVRSSESLRTASSIQTRVCASAAAAKNNVPRRALSTESGDGKPTSAADAKAAFLAKQKAAGGGGGWAKFSGSKAESTLSPEEQAKLKAETAAAESSTATAASSATGAAPQSGTSDTAASASAAAPKKSQIGFQGFKV